MSEIGVFARQHQTLSLKSDRSNAYGTRVLKLPVSIVYLRNVGCNYLRQGNRRAAVDRLVDPDNNSVTLNTPDRAANVLDQRITIELVEAS